MYTANIVWTTSTAMVEIPIRASLPLGGVGTLVALCSLPPVDARPAPLLKPVERRVLTLLAQGRTLMQIASDLDYSYQYVRKVAAAAAAQLGAKNSTQAVAIAARRGLI